MSAARDRELISAYLDGVGELAPAERKRVEELLRDEPASTAEADDVKALLGQLRATPPEGSEPDWSVLEREIRIAVGPQVPGGWRMRVRSLRWLLPIGALATGAALVLLVVHPREHDSPDLAPAPLAAAAPVSAPSAAAAGPHAEALWLDGVAVELGDVDPGLLLDYDGDDDGAGAGSADAIADDSDLLPATNFEWLDALDERAIDRTEAWLDHKKGHQKG